SYEPWGAGSGEFEVIATKVYVPTASSVRSAVVVSPERRHAGPPGHAMTSSCSLRYTQSARWRSRLVAVTWTRSPTCAELPRMVGPAGSTLTWSATRSSGGLGRGQKIGALAIRASAGIASHQRHQRDCGRVAARTRASQPQRGSYSA